MPGQKLTLSITCCPAFQNVRAIMEELQLLLTSNKEHKRVFPNVLVIGLRNGKSLKDCLFRATLPILNESRRVNHVGKKLVWSVTL